MADGKWYALLKQMLRQMAIIAPVTVAFLDTVGYVAKVEGISMQPCLNPEDNKSNDYVLLNKWSMRNFEIKHGDVVALTSPRDPDQKIIKRIVAVEGDTIRMANKRRYINVPPGHCWVEGDHLAHSMDSNYFGPVSIGLLTAKASHIVWPPSRWQKLEPALPPERQPNQWPGSILFRGEPNSEE